MRKVTGTSKHTPRHRRGEKAEAKAVGHEAWPIALVPQEFADILEYATAVSEGALPDELPSLPPFTGSGDITGGTMSLEADPYGRFAIAAACKLRDLAKLRAFMARFEALYFAVKDGLPPDLADRPGYVRDSLVKAAATLPPSLGGSGCHWTFDRSTLFAQARELEQRCSAGL